MTARLKERYQKTIAGELFAEIKLANVMQVPRLDKIVVNMGVGEAPNDARLMENAVEELRQITGQQPSVRVARRSIAGFKLRKGVPIGCMVTLRGERMYEFLDRLISIAIPRIRDFRGLSEKSFDKQGNYTMGLREQGIFPEVNMDKVSNVRGMNVTFVFRNCHSRDGSLQLLKKFGMPFRRQRD